MGQIVRRLNQRIERLPFLEHLTLHLFLGLAMSLLSLWIFYSVAEDVWENDPLIIVDAALANELHAESTPTTATLYAWISLFGSQVIVGLSVIVGLFFAWRRQWGYLIIWIIALGGGALLNTVIKQLFTRPRPTFVDPLVIEQNFSFPSAHAMMSLITYGILAYFLCLHLRNRYIRIFLVFSAIFLIMLIGISRMALGVHYFSDVIGGFAAGGTWLSVCITATQIINRRKQGR